MLTIGIRDSRLMPSTLVERMKVIAWTASEADMTVIRIFSRIDMQELILNFI